MNNIDLQEKEEALNQSMALTEVVKDLLDTTKSHLNKVYIILALSIAINLLIVIGFLVYNSQFDYSTTSTETVTTQETNEDSSINNVQGDQYNDESTNSQER